MRSWNNEQLQAKVCDCFSSVRNVHTNTHLHVAWSDGISCRYRVICIISDSVMYTLIVIIYTVWII